MKPSAPLVLLAALVAAVPASAQDLRKLSAEEQRQRRETYAARVARDAEANRLAALPRLYVCGTVLSRKTDGFIVAPKDKRSGTIISTTLADGAQIKGVSIFANSCFVPFCPATVAWQLDDQVEFIGINLDPAPYRYISQRGAEVSVAQISVEAHARVLGHETQ